MRKKIKRSIQILYAVSAVGILALFLYMSLSFEDRVFEKRKDTGYRYVTEVECVKEEDSHTPLGVKNVCRMQLRDISKESGSLIFYSIHQNVKVYVGNELVYSVEPNKDNPFGRTPGNNWNKIPMYEDDNGKTIRIELIPVYQSSVDSVPEFYFGSEIGIWLSVIKRHLPAFLLSLIAMIVGSVFLVFTINNYQNSEGNRSLLMMGMFSINIGLWKITDMASLSLFFPFSIALAYMPFFALLLVVIPFILYVKELFTEKESMIWYLPCFVSIFVTVISLGLQLAKIADLRQTLWMNHLVMAIVFFVMIVMMIREVYKKGWNGELKLMVLCVGACLTGLVADIYIYYTSKGDFIMVMGMFGFLTYIIVLGVKSFRETKKLIAYGMKAEHYAQMAYHDQLTGLYNRTAYEEYIGGNDFIPDHCIVMMFDLNNLKYCNDTYGHEKGDNYLLQSAKLIQKVFGDIGNCYRMGGDEFCVLLKEVGLEECRLRVERLREEIDVHNRNNSEGFPIQIACGYEAYEKDSDYDLGDTLRRADRRMYREKYLMKQKTQ